MDGLFSESTQEDYAHGQMITQEWRLLQLEDYARRTGQLGDTMNIQDVYAPQGLYKIFSENRERMSLLKKISQRIDTHYPGTIGKVFIVNAPWAVSAFLSVLKPIVPARLMGKLEILPTEDRRERLLEFIDDNRLPQFLGGAAPDADFMPGWDLSTGPGGRESCVVGAGAKGVQGLPMEEGDVAAFSFQVEGDGYDIDFSLRFVPHNEEGEGRVIKKPQRREALKDGSYEAPCNGTLLMIFDNSFSWINSKTIHYELQPEFGDAVEGEEGL